MQSQFERGVARLADYLGPHLNDDTFTYWGSPAPEIGDRLFGYDPNEVDPLTTVCVDAFEGSLERIFAAVEGSGLGRSFYSVSAEFKGATESIALEIEQPGLAKSIRHAFAMVKEYSTITLARVERIEVQKQPVFIKLHYAGGGTVSIEPMRFAKATDDSNRLAEGIYRGLREYHGNAEQRLRRIPKLKTAKLISICDVDKALRGEFDDSMNDHVLEERPHGHRGYHLSAEAKGLARAFQDRWSFGCGESIKLSVCQEAVARFFGARSWQHLTSISPNEYWLPFRLCTGEEDGMDKLSKPTFYRNPLEGLAAMTEYCAANTIEWFGYSNSLSGRGLILTAGDKKQYADLTPFQTCYVDDQDDAGVPTELEAIHEEDWVRWANEFLKIGVGKEEYFAKRDIKDKAVSFECEGFRIRRVQDSSLRTRICVEQIREDGSKIGYTKDVKLRDAELQFDPNTCSFTLMDQHRPGNHVRNLVTFSADLSEEQITKVVNVFRKRSENTVLGDVVGRGLPLESAKFMKDWQASVEAKRSEVVQVEG